MNKYYTPEIEELHIGFEYQQFSHLNGKYEDKTLDYSPFITILDEENCDWSEHHIRVKYLDQEDIKNLGFIQITDDCFTIRDIEYRGKLNCELRILIRKTILIYIIDEQDIEYQLFTGTIRNKSELNKLMKQLTIQWTE